jgi:hypothetical protein
VSDTSKKLVREVPQRRFTLCGHHSSRQFWVHLFNANLEIAWESTDFLCIYVFGVCVFACVCVCGGGVVWGGGRRVAFVGIVC